MTVETGDMGLPTTVVGAVVQGLARAAVERGDVDEEQVLAYIQSDAFEETYLWDTLGKVIDEIEQAASEYRPVEVQPTADFWSFFPGLPHKAVLSALRVIEMNEWETSISKVREVADREARDDDHDRHQRHVDYTRSCYLCRVEAGPYHQWPNEDEEED